MENNVINKIKYYLYWFITSTVLGYTSEVVYSLVFRGKLVNPGSLTGPFCPIYGVGIVVLILILKDSKNKIVSFINCFLAATTVEYISAYISEVYFNNKIWDYSNYFLNIHGRVCLIYSLMWAIGGFIIVNNIEPNAKKMFDKYQSKKADTFFFSVTILFLVDILLNIIF